MSPSKTAVVLGTLLLASCLNAQPPAEALLTRIVIKDGEKPIEPRGSLRFVPLGLASDPWEWPLERGRLASVDRSIPSLKVIPQLDGYWAPPADLYPSREAAEASLILQAWPLAMLRGELVPSPGAALPQKLLVRFEEARRPVAVAASTRPQAPKAKFRPAELACLIESTGAFSCPLPAANLDFSLWAPAHVAHYFWNKTLTPGGQLDLGRIQLEVGSSVVGWAVVEDGVLAADCKAELVPKTTPFGGEEAEKQRQKISSAVVQKNGFFQIHGIAAGAYDLKVSQAGFSPALAAFEVKSGTETRLTEPLLLSRPFDVVFEVTPPLGPNGQPFRLEIFRGPAKGGRFDGTPAFAGSTDLTGRATLTREGAGLFRYVVSDAAGNRLAANAGVVVADPADALVRIVFETVPVRGIVRRGEEPVAAELHFGGGSGLVRIVARSNEHGEFQTQLPRTGRWPVTVVFAGKQIEKWVSLAETPRPVEWLPIDLPAGVVFGNVRDGAGNALPKARVSVDNGLQTFHVETDEDGGFRIEGLEKGPLALWAMWAAGGRKATSAVFFGEIASEELGPVELRGLEHRRLDGEVYSAAHGRPEAGAVIVLSVLEPTDLVQDEKATTGADGNFTASLPLGVTLARAVVMAAGHPIQTFVFDPNEGPIQLYLEELAGSLELPLSPAVPQDDSPRFHPLLFHEGVELPLYLLVQWARNQGQVPGPESLAVSGLAPGNYRHCFVSAKEAAAELGKRRYWRQPGSGACQELFLGPGGNGVFRSFKQQEKSK